MLEPRGAVDTLTGRAAGSTVPRTTGPATAPRSVARQLRRFAVVCGVAGGLNTALFLLVRLWCPAYVANLIAVVGSTVVSTELNRLFTFRGERGSVWRLHLQTGLAVLYYLFSSSAVLFLLDLVVGGTTALQELLAIGTAGALVALVRFLLLRHWVFRIRARRPRAGAPSLTRPPAG